MKYDCHQCDGSFTRKDYLANHKKSKHEGVKYDCNQCDNSFALQGNIYIVYSQENQT